MFLEYSTIQSKVNMTLLHFIVTSWWTVLTLLRHICNTILMHDTVSVTRNVHSDSDELRSFFGSTTAILIINPLETGGCCDNNNTTNKIIIIIHIYITLFFEVTQSAVPI